MHLIPEFNGLNLEVFISLIQAVKRLVADQHELFLYSIIAQKLTGRAKDTIKINVTPNFPQLYEQLRFLFGKSLSALEVRRNTCIQHHNETVNDFINRFLRIHDNIIAAIHSQNEKIATASMKSTTNRKQLRSSAGT